jgi:hypothetical protein
VSRVIHDSNEERLMKIALSTAVRVVTSNGSKVKAVGGGN